MAQYFSDACICQQIGTSACARALSACFDTISNGAITRQQADTFGTIYGEILLLGESQILGKLPLLLIFCYIRKMFFCDLSLEIIKYSRLLLLAVDI